MTAYIDGGTTGPTVYVTHVVEVDYAGQIWRESRRVLRADVEAMPAMFSVVLNEVVAILDQKMSTAGYTG